jgi:hypothetical protein
MKRICELIKETFLRRTFIWVVHVVWLVLYVGFWWLFLPGSAEMGGFLFIWGGLLLALALSAGIFGDDIASGRICVLITNPLWSGELYICRMVGLSLQAAAHFVIAGLVLWIIPAVLHRAPTQGLFPWLVASWLLFNTCAALSTSLSVVVGRAYNSLLLLVVIVTGYSVMSLLIGYFKQQPASGTFIGFIKYAWPPFELLYKFGGGERGQYALMFGRYSLTVSVACVAHCLMLTIVYGAIGIILLARQEFSRVRD